MLNVKFYPKFPIPSENQTIYLYKKLGIIEIILFLFCLSFTIWAYFEISKIFSIIYTIFILIFTYRDLYEIIKKFPCLVMYKEKVIYKGNSYQWDKIENPIQYFEKHTRYGPLYHIVFKYENKKVKVILPEDSILKPEYILHYFFCFKNRIYQENINV